VPSKNAPLGLPGAVVLVDEVVVATTMVLLVEVVGAAVLVVGGAELVLVVGAAVVVVGAAEVVVGAALVVVGAAVVLVVVPPWQTKAPPAELGWQESQQLAAAPTHAVPPFGGLHLFSPLLIEQRTLPRRSTRQHVTKPGFPQVERAAHSITAPLHSCGRVPGGSPFTASPTHFT
jgi:hypothetical protein